MDFDQSRLRAQRRILEDYLSVGVDPVLALVSRSASRDFVNGVTAASLSVQLGIGLGYALDRYVDEERVTEVPDLYAAYQAAYFLGKRHISDTAGCLAPVNEPTAGETYSEAALARLQATYYAAGLLFRTGHLFEAQSLCRMFLEQVAWAYGVFEFRTYQAAARLSPTRAIGLLSDLIPAVGPLYGVLSESAHLDLEEHLRFVRFTGEAPEVVVVHGRDSLLAGSVLLDLADYWSVVLERSQWPHIPDPTNWLQSESGPVIDTQRPFLALSDSARQRIQQAGLQLDEVLANKRVKQTREDRA